MSGLLRVDVAGMPIMVRGEVERAHLEKVNQQLTKMKLALHKITNAADIGRASERTFDVCSADLYACLCYAREALA